MSSEDSTVDPSTMTVGAGDPQAPSHAAAADRPVSGGGGAAAEPAAGGGAGYRQPGSLGTTGLDEQMETDVERSAQNASPAGTPGTGSGPGDAGGVPVASPYPASGSSEESSIAQGTRAPR